MLVAGDGCAIGEGIEDAADVNRPRAGAVAARAIEVNGIFVDELTGVMVNEARAAVSLVRPGGADRGAAVVLVIVFGIGVGFGELCCKSAVSTTRGRRGRIGVVVGAQGTWLRV